MNIGEIVRNRAFGLMDSMKGKPIKNHITDISRIMNNDVKAMEMRNKRLSELLNHAKITTKFYAKINGSNLHQFPVINKSILKENFDEFLSNKYEANDLIKATTSGSYGTPFTYLLTPEKKYRQKAEVIYFGRESAYEIGKRHAYIRVTKAKSKTTLFLQNEILIDPTNINKNWLETNRNHLKDNVRVVIGYPSSLYILAKYCLEKGDDYNSFSIEGIITTAEPLLEEQKIIIEKLFRCNITSRYSTEEFGVLANQCHKGNHHINHASFEIEVLKTDKDVPAAPGEIGRIIVTDLYSHALPLIRYNTGDLGIYENKCECGFDGKILKKVIGREVETIFDTNGERVSPFAINGAMRDIENVLQYQFIQENEKVFKLLIVPVNNLREQTNDILTERFQAILGNEAIININVVETIKPLPSGKRPYIISKLNNRK
ncbi:phenylacetate--CoA ligase family protein [Bacillus sp. FJAT-49705]|uniref:Phenylacetate--CoA ligase family protein n=1 Tax=Cytobacillus citreus TaxID=2833586 RepID=A0ABS5NXP5_9BACI|nr:phenylacetate--CoA ligase family protein [Cytobacillus citreus]MBS4192609.1 phenylacetate--CoA ligase family protein [Cytobacillus citreus]